MNEPISPDLKRVKTKRKIDQICDQAELQWRAGLEPDARELARDLEPHSFPGFLSEIIKVDKEVNLKSQDQLRDFYSRHFPEYANIVESILFSLFADGTGCSDELVTRDLDASQNKFGDSFVGNRIGEYFIERKIGEGGFGVVFLARDSYLPRQVVIKIPKLDRFKNMEDLDEFLNEARNAALLNHQHILKVLHVGLDSGLPFIVQEFFEGGDLRTALKKNSYSLDATISFIEKLASATGYAHQHRIVHRDLKPANILLDCNGEPVIADFGLALHETQMGGRSGERAGTVRYMSPEQVRGEAHRLDGRTDIWSIGVIMYLMLVGQHPFGGKDPTEICEAVLFGRPRPPRQINPLVTEELDRICLKCLSLRVNDRYSSAYDLADDLKRTAEKQDRVRSSIEASFDKPPVTRTLSVVPKGLVAFDENDVDFFLDLLPGPFDRDGNPECIHFWKNQIENPARTQPVGLIYGPSGCGKSSLVSAGLLPRLADDLVVVHLESTPHDTEVRLLKGLRAKIPSLPQDLSLPDLIAGIREGQWLPKDRRLLMVFDQFEQWLHANQIDEHSQLIHALRHCDGKTVQSIILVRDDFWMAISRFFRQLEIELVERRNFASVDLFGKRHAKHVLIKFGQAYGSLPANEQELTPDQHEFLDQAIELVSENDSVICVRLVLFAETVKNRPWEVETLQRIGDANNVGILFLNQVLGDGATNPKYRYFRQPLLNVLESLLPDPGIEIKGNLKAKAELAQAAQLDSAGSDFEQVLHLLDSELRLIAPTEPDSGAHVNSSEKNSELYYQLAHDYLVPSLRAWMHSVRGQTRQGRAKLRLQALTNAWRTTGDKRFLPSFFEYCSIVSNVGRRQQNDAEQQLMRRANAHFGWRAVALLLVAMTMGAIWWKVSADRRFENTRTRVAQFLTGEPGSVSGTAELLRQDPDNAIAVLNSELTKQPPPPRNESLRIHVGLALLGDVNEERIRYLVESVADCVDAECSNLVVALSPSRLQALKEIEDRTSTNDDHWARLEILKMFLNPNHVPVNAFAFRPDPTRRSTLIHSFEDWHADWNLVLVMLNTTKDEAALSGLCVGLGRIGPEQFGERVFENLKLQMLELYRNHGSAGVHGASRWALTNWGVSLPPLLPTEVTEERKWWVNNSLMTMVRVEAGTVPNKLRDSEAPDRVDRDFFIGACEITVEQFEEFLNDPDYPADKKPTDWEFDPKLCFSSQSAINQIKQLDAILFCNWLSWKHELQDSYRKSGQVILIDGKNTASGDPEEIDEWELVENPEGYRLPTHNEWELAARAGCTGDYYFGSTFFARVPEYLWCVVNSVHNDRTVVQPVATKIPNHFGLFDMLGNAHEICWNSDLGPGDSKAFISRRGGGYNTDISGCDLRSPWPSRISTRHNDSGFRVAINDRK